MKKYCWNKNNKGGNFDAPTIQGYVASISKDGYILVSKLVIHSSGGKSFHD